MGQVRTEHTRHPRPRPILELLCSIDSPSHRGPAPILNLLFSADRPLPRGAAVALGALVAVPVLGVLAGPGLPRWIGTWQLAAPLGVALIVIAGDVGVLRLLQWTATGLVACGALLWVGVLGLTLLPPAHGPTSPATPAWPVVLAAALGAEVAGQAAYWRTNRGTSLVLVMCTGALAILTSLALLTRRAPLSW